MQKKITFFQLPRAVSQLDQKLTTIERLLREKGKETHHNFRLIRAPRMLYSISELSSLLGCSRSTAFRIKKSGRIPYYQVNRKLIFVTSAVLKSIAHGNQRRRSE